jgi:phage shock protein C
VKKVENEAATSQDKLARLLEEGKVSEEEYQQLASAMRRNAPAEHREAAESRERLRKDVARAWIAGVCAGLARHFKIDPKVPRIIAVATLFLLGPVTILLYLVLCAVMPWDDRNAARVSRADAHPFRFAIAAALLLVILPFSYCAFVVPHFTVLLEKLGVDLSSNPLVRLSFQTMSWYSPRAAALACLLCSGVYHVTCNVRFRSIFERAVIWPSFLWLLFLLSGNLLPLLSMLNRLE